MAKEYIEREAIRDVLYEADAITMKGVALLNRFPAADVRPVVRGEWRLDDSGNPFCTNCGFIPEIISLFCPHCGADMRKR